MIPLPGRPALGPLEDDRSTTKEIVMTTRTMLPRLGALAATVALMSAFNRLAIGMRQ